LFFKCKSSNFHVPIFKAKLGSEKPATQIIEITPIEITESKLRAERCFTFVDDFTLFSKSRAE
jgi:hypothetical protein